MTLFLSNRDGNGKTSEEGHYRLQTQILSGDVLQSDSMKVLQNSPTGMSVLVSPGDFKIDAGNYSYTGWNTANIAVTITTADAANPRITSIVAYVDKSAGTSASPPNNPGIIKVAAVNGTPLAVPVAPNDTAIKAAIGSSNPYIILANVRVNAAATTIVTANITDVRKFIGISTQVLNSSSYATTILPTIYPIGSVYSNGTTSDNPSVTLGFGTWVAEGPVVERQLLNSKILHWSTGDVTGTTTKQKVLGTYNYDMLTAMVSGMTIPTGYHVEYQMSAELSTGGNISVAIFLNNIYTNYIQTWSGATYRLTATTPFFKSTDVVLETTVNYSNPGINFGWVSNNATNVIRVYLPIVNAYLVRDTPIYRWRRTA